MGLVRTYIVHIIREFAEEGCTASLHINGWNHTWFNARSPMLLSDEVEESDLTVAKRYAPITSTQQNASISETLKHEVHQKFVRKKQRVRSTKIWAPVGRNVVLEACMVAANVLWRTIFVRLLHHLVALQEAGGCTIVMHADTRCVKCTFVGAKEQMDVFCVCGSCGAKHGIRRWVSAELVSIQAWPRLGLKSRARFKSCAAGRKCLKAGKEKRAAELAPHRSSSDSSSEGTFGADSDNGGQDVCGGSTVSGNDSDSSTSTGNNTKTPPQSKKYRRVDVHIGKEVVDVDAMSSDACPVRMLSEGECNVHTSS